MMPLLIYCLFYQDGVIHAFERFINYMAKGTYYKKGYIECSICAYLKKNNKTKDYADIAYIEGYLEGLNFLTKCSDEKERKEFPLFYIPINEETSKFSEDFDEFLEQVMKVEQFEEFDNKILDYAKKAIEGYKEGVIIHHPPYF